MQILPQSDVQKLFNDYMQEQFTELLQEFFSRLYRGVMKVMKSTLSARLDEMEDTITDLKQSVLMASLHPYAWVESEIVRSTILFLTTQPGSKAPLHEIFLYLSIQAGIPLPGASKVEKYEYILRTLRKVPELREWEGMLFELVSVEVREEREILATSDEYRRSVLHKSLCDLAAEQVAEEPE